MSQSSSQKNIAVVTTGRADYGILSPLLTRLQNHSRFNLQLIATGGHLANDQGYTLELVQAEYQSVHTVAISPSDDSANGVCHAVGGGLAAFSDLYARLQPDLLIVLGDRYELWAACVAASLHRIPVAHIHGGELTLGVQDDTIRHCVTKMSSVHFPATPRYGQRIVQMGESPDRVFPVGALGVEVIRTLSLMSHEALKQHCGVDFQQEITLVTYHPVTLDAHNKAQQQIEALLQAAIDSGLRLLITASNTDIAGRVIQQVIAQYQQRYPSQIYCVKSLGQRGYLSALKHASLVLGNSSSGIIESPSFGTPTINVGERQKGRTQAENIINCECTYEAICEAIIHATAPSFGDKLQNLSNPYGDGFTSEKMIQVLETLNLDDNESMIKKGFHDL